MIAPIDEPQMKSMGIWASRRAWMAPTWAKARAPPPEKTVPTLWPVTIRARRPRSPISPLATWNQRVGSTTSSHWRVRPGVRGLAAALGVQQDQVRRPVQQRLLAFGIYVVGRAVGIGDEKDVVDLARTQQPPVAFMPFSDMQHVVVFRLDMGEGLGRGAVEAFVEDAHL